MSSIPDNPPATSPVDALKPLRRWTIAAWTVWFLSIGLLWWQHRTSVMHPPALLFVGLLAFTAGAALVVLVFAACRVLRGPQRLYAVGWLPAALFPVLSWSVLFWYVHHNGQRRHIPHDLGMMLASRAGHSLMEAEANYLYPHRLETDHLVMFYDDKLTEPEADLGAMEEHVANMEAATGRPLRTKIHWARGRLLGRWHLCCYGIALGSDASPAGTLDRHELAHAFLNQYYAPDTEPPTLLSEGWAESQSREAKDLAQSALDVRRLLEYQAKASEAEMEQTLNTLVDRPAFGRLVRKARGPDGIPSYLRELTDDFWYHHDSGPVYSVGGAFVSFLLRKYGAERFTDLYFACRPGTFEAACRGVLGLDLDTLEKDFWHDAERLAGDPLPGR